MKQIIIDASNWANRHDFYACVLVALGAPDWHGGNLDALYDSIVTDQINAVAAPYVVRIINSANLTADLSSLVADFLQLFDEARAEAGIEVYATVQPPH